MSDVFGAPEVRQITPGLFPLGTGATPVVPPLSAPPAGAANGGLLPILVNIASMLGINPTQLASSIVANPEAVADGLDQAGAPSPDVVAGAPDTGVGEALLGSEPIDYKYDPTAGIGVGVQPGLSAPPIGAPLPQDAPVSGTSSDTGVVAAGNAPPAAPGDLGALLSGVTVPDAPQPPQIGGGGAPQPNAIRPQGMDEIIRAALAVARPESQGLTLQNAIRRS